MSARCDTPLDPVAAGLTAFALLRCGAKPTRSIRRRFRREPSPRREQGADAFSIPIAMLDSEQAEAFAKGKEQFNEAWVVAPDPGGVWGLGPDLQRGSLRALPCQQRSRQSADDGQ